jgi:polyisoprenoid-binding protein YceI
MSAKPEPMRVLRLATLIAACLAVTACGTTTATPTPATSSTASVTSTPASLATSVASTRAAPTSTPSTAVRSPTEASSAPASGAAASSASKTATATAATTLTFDADNSHASYHAQEQLVGRNVPSEAVGTSKGVTGSIVFAPDGSIAANQSQVQVDLNKLTSDESRRDNFIKGTTLQTSRYPNATFVPKEAQGLPTPLPTDGEVTFQLIGDLTVHGVTQPVTWQVTAQFNADSVTGNATTNVNISDFGMSPPKAGPVLSIQDGLTLELAFSAARDA